MAFTDRPSLPRDASEPAGTRRDRGQVALGYLALVASAAVAGLGLAWLFSPEWNPYATDGILHTEQALLAPDGVAIAAIVTGLAGVVLALLPVGRGMRPDFLVPLGLASAALAVAMGTAFGSMSVIAVAGYLFGLAAVVAGVATIIIALFRAPRFGLALLAGLAAVIAASVWVGGMTLEGIGKFAMEFAGALAADAPGLLVTGILIAAIFAWSAQAVIAIRASRGGRRFEGWLVRHRRAITILAALGPLPYAVVRATWMTPWPLFGPSADQITPDVLATGLMLGSGAAAASILTLGLILPWGTRFPGWIPRLGGRTVPTPVAVVPGLLAAAVLCISALPLLLMIGAEGVIDGVLLNLVLPLWLWGPMLALAVWAYAAWRDRARADAPDLPADPRTRVS